MQAKKILLLALAVSTPLCAQDVKIVGTLNKPLVAAKNPTMPHSHSLSTPNRSIKLLKVELSKPAEIALTNRTNQVVTLKNHLSATPHLPKKVELGMNNVPVLDQGSFGTCVTFASTAAIDAVLGKGDYVSQLCQLQLGNYLETNSYNESGWDGAYGRSILNQMDTFGIVSKAQQQTIGCGGLTDYPQVGDSVPSSFVNPEDYHQMSESINETVDWSPILDGATAFGRADTNVTLNDVKKALKEQDRVTFGVLLLDFDLGMMGAVGSHSAHFDSWVLTPEIARDIYLRPEFGGHEMIITGYDDDAVAVDEQGQEHKGLLTLRNSWGAKIGDKGNFYMSYDYFKVLVIEAQRIRNLRSSPADGGVDSFTA